ncbi:hypothetical protein EOD39_19562 [Acipenser ruthenus]|uniref:Uncharacterized protein n=1 Tax=Acipenser ruthenus TaxID=7906 RepID=A0A444UXV8_ACIRT|nr:hypothetical protein EOD39_19562 [Acipenser ruthenus]
MGVCHSLRSRVIGPQSSIAYTGRGGGTGGTEGDQGHADLASDPQLRDRLRAEEKARMKAENKRSRSIDKSLKAEKREYKQTHRLLLLGQLPADNTDSQCDSFKGCGVTRSGQSGHTWQVETPRDVTRRV